MSIEKLPQTLLSLAFEYWPVWCSFALSFLSVSFFHRAWDRAKDGTDRYPFKSALYSVIGVLLLVGAAVLAYLLDHLLVPPPDQIDSWFRSFLLSGAYLAVFMGALDGLAAFGWIARGFLRGFFQR